jgi:hypothetical protein
MIIGFCGLAGSGKDTSADFLVKNDMFVKVALADPLKRICREVYAFTDEQLWGPSAERNKPDKRYKRTLNALQEAVMVGLQVPREYLYLDAYLTPRYALQQLGTEWGRNCYPNTWVDLALRVADKLLDPTSKQMHRYTAREGLQEAPWDPEYIPMGVVFSDIRFLNEVLAINAAGGYVFQLMRGQGLEGAAGQHRSETELTTIPKELFKGIIDNREWTLDQLESYLHGLIQIDLKG